MGTTFVHEVQCHVAEYNKLINVTQHTNVYTGKIDILIKSWNPLYNNIIVMRWTFEKSEEQLWKENQVLTYSYGYLTINIFLYILQVNFTNLCAIYGYFYTFIHVVHWLCISLSTQWCVMEQIINIVWGLSKGLLFLIMIVLVLIFVYNAIIKLTRTSVDLIYMCSFPRLLKKGEHVRKVRKYLTGNILWCAQSFFQDIHFKCTVNIYQVANLSFRLVG